MAVMDGNTEGVTTKIWGFFGKKSQTDTKVKSKKHEVCALIAKEVADAHDSSLYVCMYKGLAIKSSPFTATVKWLH
jgi:hypothetical protein